MSRLSAVSAAGATRLVETLERLGVELAFGLPGVHNLAIWKALAGSRIRLVGVRHEQAAVYGADGYARATGRLGVALVTTGPGAANTLGATGEAMASASPVLIIATDIPSGLRRTGLYRGVLHETRDQAAMFGPVTKAAEVVSSADEIAGAVASAARVALAPQSGPVYVGIPTDFLSAAVASYPPPPPPAPASAPPLDCEHAAALLAGAERPLIWAGGGAVRSGAGAMVGELAQKLAAPVLTTYAGRGLIPPEHPCFVPGPPHARAVGTLWDEADVVVAVGSDLDGMMTQNWMMPAPPKLIAVNVDEADANKSYAADMTLVGDVQEVLAELVPQVPDRAGDVDGVRRRLAAVADDVAADVRADDEGAAAWLSITERVLPRETVVVADMCIPGYWLAGYRRVPLPRKLAFPMGWGTLGFAFPASLGAALAGAGPTVCVTGDGGFLFACGELATVVQERIALTIVLVDDGGYGMLRFDQERAGDGAFGVDLATPDFAALARSFGVAAVTLDGFGAELEEALGRAVFSNEPSMIVVRGTLKPPPTTSPRWYRRGA